MLAWLLLLLRAGWLCVRACSSAGAALFVCLMPACLLSWVLWLCVPCRLLCRGLCLLLRGRVALLGVGSLGVCCGAFRLGSFRRCCRVCWLRCCRAALLVLLFFVLALCRVLRVCCCWLPPSGVVGCCAAWACCVVWWFRCLLGASRFPPTALGVAHCLVRRIGQDLDGRPRRRAAVHC